MVLLPKVLISPASASEGIYRVVKGSRGYSRILHDDLHPSILLRFAENQTQRFCPKRPPYPYLTARIAFSLPQVNGDAR